MLFGLNTFTTFLNYVGSSKVPSSPNNTRPHNTRPHNIFAPRHPRLPRSRSARLHAAKSAARLHSLRSTANPAANKADQHSTAGTGTAHGMKQRSSKHRRAKMRPLLAGKPLRRYNTLVPKSPTHPQPPGAFIIEPSFVMPGFPGLNDQHPPPIRGSKAFFRCAG